MGNFVKVADFPSRMEAETVGHALDQYGIPFLVRTDDIGIFGPGFIMPSAGGASLWVPAERMPEVTELLACVVGLEELEEDEPEDDEAAEP